jgi:23S rRNA (uracil1939-C5)-methyltransferase
MGEAREQLRALNAPRIVYVSCNPESLARDLNALEKFGYIIRAIQPVDMFPQTHHIENVVLLERA